jgi:8-oxo-dGTP pyrophosphatase MutT (NUDIX family)
MCEGAYCVLVFEGEMYGADYDGAHNLIGGRVDQGETPAQALLRELAEEAKLGVGDLLMIRDTGERIAFSSERCPHPSKQEIHYFYVVVSGKKPESGDINVSKVSKSELLDSMRYANQKEAVRRILERETF